MTITIEIDNEEALKEFGPALRQEANKRIEGRVDAVVEVGNYGSFDIAQETVISPSPSPTPLPSAVPSYATENVSTKVVKIIQSYTGIVNRMVWRKF